MSINIFNKNFRIIILFIILAELLSFLGYYYGLVNFMAFFAIVISVLILSLYRLEYGLFILLAELFIGSFGYLFYFETGGFKISIRLALWLIIMSVWSAKTVLNWLKTRKLNIAFLKAKYFKYFFVLFIFAVWGLANGFLNGNTISDIFFDFNGWLYFLLVFPIYGALGHENNLPAIKQIFLASIIWLSAKTLVLAYFFSHSFGGWLLNLYRWLRLSETAEITQVVPGFSRIFMQSHIFVLIGFFIALFYFLKLIIEQNLDIKKFLNFYFLLLTLLLSAIIISFSRSFWIGLAGGGLAVWLLAIFKLKIKFKQFAIFNLSVLFVIILSLALAFLAVKFPYPAPLGEFDAANLFGQRASAIYGEAGASSRWQLLTPLWQKIKAALILGQGFGATITYISSDPRILASSPNGEYTTYAFEWGWLDVWLKLGIFGLLAYLALFAKIIFDGIKNSSYLALSLTAGLIVVMAVNITSPYVNHPLGIGYLLIAAAMMERLKNDKFPMTN